ncbi:hypothetical protein FRUB_06940 [Fimbriiglobus ruber]|uniref:Uncharacterized protein n=1 Tax=Fimbriiglobus ruber TaxID=1908690 RepID=A0A225D8A1_9BACT|nr:hypothetical protein FRUB_06940 [Fimbriiglobus ruber]
MLPRTAQVGHAQVGIFAAPHQEVRCPADRVVLVGGAIEKCGEFGRGHGVTSSSGAEGGAGSGTVTSAA